MTICVNCDRRPGAKGQSLCGACIRWERISEKINRRRPRCENCGHDDGAALVVRCDELGHRSGYMDWVISVYSWPDARDIMDEGAANVRDSIRYDDWVEYLGQHSGELGADEVAEVIDNAYGVLRCEECGYEVTRVDLR